MAEKKALPKSFGPSFPGNFPEEMRRMVWPLCCGFSILSGFKTVNVLTDDELIDQINTICGPTDVPRLDFQVYGHEHMNPKITFLTLNSEQMSSKKITTAVEKAGFVRIGVGKPRGSDQGLYMLDRSNTFKTDVIVKGKAKVAA